MAVLTQNPLPFEYSPKIKVVPSDPDRLPYIPVQILYLIAQALPQPSQVFNLARVNKETWDYLQPALYECEVTYEARLVARFGFDGPDAWEKNSILRRPYIDSTSRINDSVGDHDDDENDGRSNARYRPQCAHGLVTELCEVCGQRIAVEDKSFRTNFTTTSMAVIRDNTTTQHQDFFRSRGMTALHWACRKGEKALPVARKAIEAAKAHQRSYIDGRGHQMRRLGPPPLRGEPPRRFGEIPPPLFTAAAFGNTKLCEKLIEAGCNVNLLQAMELRGYFRGSMLGPHFRIHESCVRHPYNPQIWECGGRDPARSKCQTAGHVALAFGKIDTLKFLLDRGLDPLMGAEPLIHRAARTCDLAGVKTLLDRFPEIVSHRWENMTPLHALCMPSGDYGKETHSLEDLKAIAAYLVQKGAYLEAEGGMVGSRLTPLQFAVKTATTDTEKWYAPEALVELGAIWNRFLNSSGATILDYCVQAAALKGTAYIIATPGLSGIYTRVQESIAQNLAFAKMIKAMVRNTPASMPDPALVPGSQPPMQAFLGAFRGMIIDSGAVWKPHLDTFAIEAVGRLLLSTGISPDQSDIEKWRLVIAENRKGQKGADWVASPWRELISDLPQNVGDQ